jgi:AcrR family transcriptional regulator
MEKQMTNRQKQAVQTKQRILDCAVSLFRENNYEKVSISRIAEAAHVSVGNFYNYYVSKDDLLLSLYPHFDNLVESKLAKKSYPCSLDAIRDLFYHQTGGYTPVSSNFVAQLFRLQLGRDKYIIKEDRYFHQYLKKLVRHAKKAVELHRSYYLNEIVELMLRTSRGVLNDWALHDGAYAVEEKTLHDLDHILRAFQLPKSPC